LFLSNAYPKTGAFQLPMFYQLKPGGSIARIADPNSPKGYSTPYDVMLSI